ncbi:MAG TPA: helix-turn-helix domain-containing protein [Chloroflexota bacterium]|jgi:biotin operon repressor|nr:helix-turn-helix domain-containing protein [Chloroflexota bacterium]
MPHAEAGSGGVVWVEDEVLRAGFTQIPNVMLSTPALSAGAKLTYVGLLSFAWQDGSCFPGQETLAERVGAGRRSVVRYLQELQDLGLLVITRRGQGMTNLYTLRRIGADLAAKLKCPPGTSGSESNGKCQSGTSRGAKPAHPEVPTWLREKDPRERDPAGRTSKARRQPTPHRCALDAPPTSSAARAPPFANGAASRVGERSESEEENSSPAAAMPARRPLRARLPPAERRRYDEERRRVVDYLADFARELGDGAPLASSVTRAVNLMRRAGVGLEEFVEALYHARAVTKERWAAVRKEAKKPGDPFPRKEAMAYFFAELEHALGLRELPEAPAEHAARKEAEEQERRRERDRHPDWARARGPRQWVQTYKPGEGLPALEADGEPRVQV